MRRTLVRGRTPWSCRFRPDVMQLDDRVVPSATLVSDIVTGGSGSDPQELTAVGNDVYFSADDGTGDRELWKSDGTAGGTARVVDINAGGSSVPEYLTAAGGLLYFTADDGIHGRTLWKSDGTVAGTMRLTDFDVTAVGGPIYAQRELVAVGNTVFFMAHAIDGSRDLWKTDGTVAGTILLKDASTDDVVTSMVAFNGELYFGYSPAPTPSGDTSELWKSNGTVVGTGIVTVVGTSTDPLHTVGSIGGLTAGSTRLFFVAEAQYHDIETWVSDGTGVGTFEVDLSPDLPGDPQTSYPGQTNYSDGYADTYTVVGDKVYFSDSTTSLGSGLIEIDGLTGIATKIDNVGGGPTGVGTKVYYFAGSNELRVYDTVAGVISTVATGINPYDLTVVGDKVYFGMFTYFNGYELWETDVNTGVTQMVANINPGFFADSNPRFLTAVDGTLYFTANDGTHGRELWQVVP